MQPVGAPDSQTKKNKIDVNILQRSSGIARNVNWGAFPFFPFFLFSFYIFFSPLPSYLFLLLYPFLPLEVGAPVTYVLQLRW